MQLAGLAVLAHSAVIVDTVRHVRSLLDFGDERPCANGVHAPRRQEEEVAGLHGVVAQHVGQGVVRHAALVLLGGDLLREARLEVGAAIGADDVPHLRLAVLAVTHLRQGIVGVHLDREVVACVDELHQQRKFGAETLVDGLTDERLLELVDKLRQRAARISPPGDYGFVACDARELPALAAIGHGCIDALVGRYLVTAPDQGFEDRFESERFHCSFSFLSNMERANA